jgi:hypothetical protein
MAEICFLGWILGIGGILSLIPGEKKKVKKSKVLNTWMKN